MNTRLKNIVLFILFWNVNILAAENNLQSNILVSDRNLSVYSEKILISAVNNIKQHKIEKALEQLKELLKINPDFKVAQLIYADLMLSRSQPITDFGNIQNASFENINSLLSEIKARWDFHEEKIDENKLPSSLITLANTQRHVIIVDASASRLFLFENENGSPRVKSDFYVTIGKNGTEKYTEGDQKTPIGVYFVTGFIPSEDLPDLYGDGAYPIDYPNAWDQRHGRTGYGIWLHGTPSNTYSRAPKDSNGCVIVSNTDLNTLSEFIDEGKTPVIITNSINWLNKQEWELRNNKYNFLIEKWRQDWQSRDVDLYLQHYSKEYVGLGKDYNSWVEYKRRVIPMKKFIKVNLTNKSVFLYPENPNLMVVTFLQDYASDTFNRKFIKRQYWRMENDGKWRIIYEGAAS
jgi:murein L,D-transpeptidase YafK